jgi:hypothetical protein
MDSLAPSPTTAIDTAINSAPSAINTAIDSAPSAIDTTINIAPSTINTVIDTTIRNASPIDNIDDVEPTTASGLAVDHAATAVIGSVSGSTRPTSAVTGGFDMAFGLFNFHVDNDGDKG